MLKYLLASLILLSCFNVSESIAASAPWVGNDLKGQACQGSAQGYGPYDYLQRGSLKDEITLVESAHFTPDVENLIKGNASGANPEGDIDYTLRAWPNHHRALLSIIKFQMNIKNGISPYKSIKTPPECYLQRAIHFSPRDAFSYSLYGYYLGKMNKKEEAKKYYKKALEIAPDNAKIAYSYSLLLTDLKEYDEALKYARIAYQSKNTPDGLRKILQKNGAWQE